MSFIDPWTIAMMKQQRGFAAMRRSAGRQVRAGRYRPAMRLLEDVLEHDPEDVRCLNMLGVCHMQVGGFAEALEVLERVLAIEPEHHDASLNYAKAAVAGEVVQATVLEKAESRLRRALEKRPDEAEGWRILAVFEEKLGRFAAAAEALDRFCELEPGARGERLKAAYLVLASSPEVALERFRALRTELPDSVEVRYGEVSALVQMENKPEAEAALDLLRGPEFDAGRIAKLRAAVEELP